jgi:hypothetical protein
MTYTFRRQVLIGLAVVALLAGLVVAGLGMKLVNASPSGLPSVPGPNAPAAQGAVDTTSNSTGSASNDLQTVNAAEKLPSTDFTRPLPDGQGSEAATSTARDTVCPNNEPCDDTNK